MRAIVLFPDRFLEKDWSVVARPLLQVKQEVSPVENGLVQSSPRSLLFELQVESKEDL